MKTSSLLKKLLVILPLSSLFASTAATATPATHKTPKAPISRPAHKASKKPTTRATSQPTIPTYATSLFRTLQGKWHGRATKTPVGPLDYHMSFRRIEHGVYGKREGSASVHHWTFHYTRGKLRLRFLSTFGSNQDPVDLTLVRRTHDRYVFLRPGLLQVALRLFPQQVKIHIHLRGHSHVKITLRQNKRSEPQSPQR